jgi:hypothetical protein
MRAGILEEVAARFALHRNLPKIPRAPKLAQNTEAAINY